MNGPSIVPTIVMISLLLFIILFISIQWAIKSQTKESEYDEILDILEKTPIALTQDERDEREMERRLYALKN